MSDDLNKKIKQITDMLGQENLPDNIKGLLSLLASPNNKEESSTKSEGAPAINENKATRSELEENIEMVRKIKKIMDKANTKNDPRINLLTSIRPFLNNSRQKKLNNCINLLRMTNLTSFIDDHDKGDY